MKPTKHQRYVLAYLAFKRGQACLVHSEADGRAWMQEGILPVEMLQARTLDALIRHCWVEPYEPTWKRWVADAQSYRITDAGKAALA